MKWRSPSPMKLGLGTVQFGTSYGLSNAEGQPSKKEVEAILSRAASAGIEVLDTAPSPLYGDSEKILGQCLPATHSFRIISKTPAFKGTSITSDEANQLSDSFKRSLELLKQSHLYGLLIHHAQNLTATGGDLLFEAMKKLKDEKLVQKIGVSVYTAAQIDQIQKRFPLDLIQVPINVLDQRLVTGGQLAALRNKSIEIYARSVFLQGALLMTPDRLPAFFAPARETLQNYHRFSKEHGLTPVQAALHYVLNRSELDSILVGVNSAKELDEILSAVSSLPGEPIDWSPFAVSVEKILDPSQWPAVQGGRA